MLREDWGQIKERLPENESGMAMRRPGRCGIFLCKGLWRGLQEDWQPGLGIQPGLQAGWDDFSGTFPEPAIQAHSAGKAGSHFPPL